MLAVGLMVAVLSLGTSGCLYDTLLGKSSATANLPPGSHPCDGVFIEMVRAIEEQRPERFAATVDPSATPNKDQLWMQLTNFLKIADQIEYVITVERRNAEGTTITYIFTWERKFENRANGQLVTARGHGEWVFLENLGSYTLLSATGQPLF